MSATELETWWAPVLRLEIAVRETVAEAEVDAEPLDVAKTLDVVVVVGREAAPSKMSS